MRVLICGDRNWDKQLPIDVVVGGFARVYGENNVVVIHGGCVGADLMAASAAQRHGLKIEMYEANWTKYGKAAGPIRNKHMLVFGKPDVVVAFHSDLENSRGTKNMIEQAKKAKKPVYLVSEL